MSASTPKPASTAPASASAPVLASTSIAPTSAPTRAPKPAPIDPRDLAVVRATLADVPQVMGFYDDVIAAVSGTDNDPLWERGIHPSEDELARAVREGGLLTGWLSLPEGGRVLASAIIVNEEVAEGYDKVPWRVAAQPHEVAVVHLFAVHPSLQGRRIAHTMIDRVREIAREQGKRVIRLDTLGTNEGAQRLYEGYGFDNRGHARLAYTDPRVTDFVLYELEL
ncbi:MULTISPECIES: GNAT family N-acetyltransferase [unclassified Adlercreutzia]|uniref:GNAT family N-acetyltransferase n=1 Tax=unclassified Adlercreutzia TaxID=2636013 RepID=UPI0013EA23F6|nr:MULTISPECIES: GNAT family N-acetyltransferase [unclassified Adlercreutzia]